MDKITKLEVVEQKQANGVNVAERINDLLDFIAKGEVKNIAFVGIGNDNSVISCYANGSNPYAMIGGIEKLKSDLINNCIE